MNDSLLLCSPDEIRRQMKHALIVDDDLECRIALKIILENAGFEVIEARNGAVAVEKFHALRPDIIFMDVEMPVMNGIEAAKRIKQNETDSFIPLIFLTSHNDNYILNLCIKAGGDDFLSKPVNHTILISKIHAMCRIQALLKQTAAFQNQMQNEEEVAEKIFREAITAPNDKPEHLHQILQPASLFSGDMILTSYTPANDLDILVGDFTGHGLTAAIGALPASEIFHAMSKKGFSGTQILETINQKLKKLLPTGIFMSAQFVRINRQMHIEACNCGMPDILIFDSDTRKIQHRIASKTLPLGITNELTLKHAFQYFPIEYGSRVLLFSDGVIEARDRNDNEFGQTQLEQVIENSGEHEYAIDHVFNLLHEHLDQSSQDDDISLLEAILTPELFPTQQSAQTDKATETVTTKKNEVLDQEEVSISITYRGNMLRDCDPAPAIVDFINNSAAVNEHKQELYMIITELFVNALDHGVLGLNSEMKSTPEGFTEYFVEREKRLSEINDGFVRITVTTVHKQQTGRVIMRVDDSGSGFDYEATKNIISDPSVPSGRGIKLISELCDGLNYIGAGNQAEAVYSWGDAK